MNENLKYKLTDECITIGTKKLYRIEALKDFNGVKKGDKGGFVESEKNLSQYGNCWIYGNSKVYENATVMNDAITNGESRVYGNSLVCGASRIHDSATVYEEALISGESGIYEQATVCGNTEVKGSSRIYGTAKIYRFAVVDGEAEIGGDATVSSISDYIVFKNWWSSGRYFTWTRSNNMWKVGCFYGTGEELIERAYKGRELSAKEYERVVKYVESILKEYDYR